MRDFLGAVCAADQPTHHQTLFTFLFDVVIDVLKVKVCVFVYRVIWVSYSCSSSYVTEFSWVLLRIIIEFC